MRQFIMEYRGILSFIAGLYAGGCVGIVITCLSAISRERRQEHESH